MVIHNFYMVILYTLCGYSLLCLCVKLLLDRNREKKAEKKEKIICDFFLWIGTEKKRQRKRKK